MTAPARYARAIDETLAPGAILDACLTAMGRTQADLARSTGLSTKHVNQLIMGKVSLSSSVAKLLQAETGIPARLWLAFQAVYELATDNQVMSADLCVECEQPITQDQEPHNYHDPDRCTLADTKLCYCSGECHEECCRSCAS